ncbi:acetamidase/formamidase family protein [Neisseria leonii]|uniref:acetamidase/formamidase family protein n=1 Tax=Neisseria leonii TaxID=2995413 RepID=UPI00237BB8C8|nr:acetamidase/formamidase family protein [Neisseria sp. 3986]MDD9325149.1 acetamidase/formamidase family protein [Neisseria sp. 3986]
MRIGSEHTIFSLSASHLPAARAVSGDKVTFETLDCFSNTVKSARDVVSGIDFSKVNPATGPLFVEGAQPGDILKVSIQAIRVAKQGVVVAAPGLGQLAGLVGQEETVVCTVSDTEADYLGIRLPLRKMVGVIGTAAEGEGISTGTPDRHGGNLDTLRITEGSIVYLPVNVEGALLALGDLHAVMGNGEVMGSGLEICGEVDVVVEVLKDVSLPLPFVETEQLYISLASDQNLERACQQAVEQMARFITDHTTLSLNQAGMFLSLAGHLVASQVVNPQRTMRVEVEKALLESVRK